MSLSHAIVQQLIDGPMSLADLQRATGVSLPTLRRAVLALTEHRWIRIVGQAEANGGRPAKLYGLDETHFVLVGVHLQLPGIRLIATDLSGAVLFEEKIFDRVVPTPHAAEAALLEYVTRMDTTFSHRVILGVGIAAPGFIDPLSGDIISIGRVPTWESFPLCRRLEELSGLPVLVANDVDCMAFSEFLHSSEPLDKNLAYLGYDEAVKASFVLNGEVYRGSLGNAGLIAGHLLQTGGESHGDSGQDLLTVMGVNRRFEERLAEESAHARQPYAHILAVMNPRERFRQILNCLSPETAICHEIARDLIASLAAVAANIIFIIQPDAVVIGGLLNAMPDSRFSELEGAVRSHLPPLISHSVMIRQGRLNSQNAAAIGAVQHFLRAEAGDPSSPLFEIPPLRPQSSR